MGFARAAHHFNRYMRQTRETRQSLLVLLGRSRIIGKLSNELVPAAQNSPEREGHADRRKRSRMAQPEIDGLALAVFPRSKMFLYVR